MLRAIQLHARLVRNLAVAGALFLIFGTVVVTAALPAQAAAPAQAQSGTPSPGGMMGEGMMGQGMSMAEMGAMMDQMMASMPMSGTMSMDDMGQMMGQMQMMAGMMHQQMGQMQMMMGQGMMEGGMMGQGMSGEGMSEEGMSMPQMGHMMQMMGMMHQQMAMMNMMHAMMVGHMSGDMMGMMGEGMMGEGMMNQDASPDAAQATTTAEPTATAELTATAESTTTAESDTTPNATATPTAASGADTSVHPDHPLAATTQHATAGAVTVEVVPLVDDEILDIVFAVTLETHSVELNYDLAEQAILSIGDAEFAPTSWAPDAADGHHVAGTLHFTIDHPAHAEMGRLGEVTLDLGEIDGQPVTLNFAVE